jgi:ABC-type nitrate/sulfonate/bicarbonate transport system substrate-binding protein
MKRPRYSLRLLAHLEACGKQMMLSAAALLLTGALQPAQAVDTVKLSIASTSSNYAPYFVAIEKGYFKEEGLNIELIKAPGGTATAALLSGDVPYSTSGSAAMSAAMKGAPIKLVYFPWDRPTYQVWATQPGINSLQDLKGKTIGIQSRGDTFEIAMRMILMKEGIDPGSVSYTALGFGSGRFATVLSGSLPATIISRDDVGKLRAMGGFDKGKMIFDMYDVVRMSLTSLAVPDSLLQKNRDQAKRFIRASIKGARYAAAFKEPTIDMVAKYAGGPDARVGIAASYDDTMASASKNGTISPSAMEAEIKVRGQIMELPAGRLPKIDRIFDVSIAEEVNKELDASGWKPVQ